MGCNYPGCSGIKKSHGKFCPRHEWLASRGVLSFLSGILDYDLYRQWRNKIIVGPAQLRKCGVVECPRPARAHGLCKVHATQLGQGMRFETGRMISVAFSHLGKCAVLSCQRQVRLDRHLYCSSHRCLMEQSAMFPPQEVGVLRKVFKNLNLSVCRKPSKSLDMLSVMELSVV